MRRSLQTGGCAPLPSHYPMGNSVGQWTAIGAVAALKWPGDANELNLERVSRGPRHGITIPAEVDKGKVRSDLRVSLGQRLTGIAGSLQREARAHAVHQREVYGRLKRRSGRRLVEVDGPQWMILGEGIFRRFKKARG